MLARDFPLAQPAAVLRDADGRGLVARRPRRRWHGALFLGVGVVLCATRCLAQQADTGAAPGALKKLTLEQLMNLQVTSVSRRPENLSQAASAIQVITADDIRRSGATSIPEALRLVSNLELAQIDSRQWAISARGFNNTTANKLLVLIDGRSVYTELYAGVFWDVQLVPLWDVDRIEVISGPGATLWGANAVNGVINIITKRAQDAQGLYVQGGGGTELAGTGGVRYGGAVGANVHYRIYGTAFSRDQTDLPNGQRAADDWHMGQGGVRLDWDGSQVNQVSVQGDVYNTESARASAAAAFGDTASGSNLVVSGTHVFSPTSDARVQLYDDRTHRNFPGTLTDDLDTYDIDFQHHIRIASRHDVVWGLGYRLVDDSVTNAGRGLAFLPPHVQLAWFTGFAQDEIALIRDRLRLTIGTKVDHNDYTGVEVQPSGRLSWTPTQGGVVWAAVSRAVREPSRIDRDLFAPAQPPYLLDGGPSFQSERLMAYELGYRAQVHQALTVSVSTFYNSYDDLRGEAATNPPAPLPIVITNDLQGRSYGAEVTVDYRITDAWRLRGGYTEMRVHVEPKPGSTDTTGEGAEAADPERWLTLRSSLDLPAHVTFDADGRYVGAIANQQVPAYAELDLRVAWQPAPTLELSVVGQNLLHSEHAEFGALTTRQEIPRSVYGLVAWHF